MAHDAVRLCRLSHKREATNDGKDVHIRLNSGALLGGWGGIESSLEVRDGSTTVGFRYGEALFANARWRNNRKTKHLCLRSVVADPSPAAAKRARKQHSISLIAQEHAKMSRAAGAPPHPIPPKQPASLSSQPSVTNNNVLVPGSSSLLLSK